MIALVRQLADRGPSALRQALGDVRTGAARRAQLRRLGWPAVLGAALAATGLLLSLTLVPRVLGQRQALDEQAHLLERRAVHGSQTPERLTPGAEAQRFRAGFPESALRQQRVAALLALADRAGLGIARSEFRHETDREAGLTRYRLSLPLEGSYPQLRAFIESALRADPALSLDRVRLRRADAMQPRLQAELNFTLHALAEAAPDTAPTMPPPRREPGR